MFSTIKNKLRGLYGKVTGTQTIETVLGINSNMSSDMKNAIARWKRLYKDEADWLKEPTKDNPEKVVSLGLAKQIASEKARMACLEMKSEITSPADINEIIDDETGLRYSEIKPKGDISRALYLNEQYKEIILDKIKNQLEMGIALGGFAVKPYVIKQSDGSYKFAADFSNADGFIPISFDANGNLTEAAFVEKILTSDYIYSRVEHHKYVDGKATVKNRAFRAENTKMQVKSGELGKEITLTAVPQWAALAKEAVIPTDKPLFSYFKMPIANSIDTNSPLGMSVYGGATEKLIRDADEQYSRMIWEFEGGEMAIDMDETFLKRTKDADGNIISELPRKQARLYRLHEYDDSTNNWNPHTPTLRDVSFINGLNEIKREIEKNCAIAPGTISDPNDVAKTAEEIRSGKPASMSSTIDIQKALEKTLEHIVYIMNVYVDLYNICPDGDYEISFEWGNGIKEDPDKEATRKMAEITHGLATDVDYMEYQYGLTRKQAIDKVKEIQAYNAWKAKTSVENTNSDMID